MASVVVEGRTDVPTVDAVWGHVGSLGGGDVGDKAGAWWGKRGVEEMGGLVEASVG